jgi:hypothetical protein
MGTILLLSGRAGSGKDTVFSILNEGLDCSGLAFGTALKNVVIDLCKLFTGQTYELDAMDHLWYKEQVRKELSVYTEAGEFHPSIRFLLQNIGTEILRKHLGESVFIRKTLEECHGKGNGLVVIKDCRFPNELSETRAFGRDTGRRVVLVKISRASATIHDHSSENMNESFDSDYELRNDGNLNDLRQKVTEMIRDLRLEKYLRW